MTPPEPKIKVERGNKEVEIISFQEAIEHYCLLPYEVADLREGQKVGIGYLCFSLVEGEEPDGPNNNQS